METKLSAKDSELLEKLTERRIKRSMPWNELLKHAKAQQEIPNDSDE